VQAARNLAVTVAIAVGGCAEPVELSTVAQGATVESFVETGCSTEVVIELSRQIAAEVDCMMPGQLVELPADAGLVFTGAAVLPYASEEGRADLLAAAAVGGTIEINSAYRTVAQQYLLFRWFEAGRCGITAAAEPGESNHESGRAIDVANWPERVDVLEMHGWAQTVPGDEVHFDHLASPDIRGSDVHAFQRLWNANHPEDPIDEDGAWGPATEERLAASPAEGFPVGPSCDPDDWDPGDPVRPEDDADGLVGGCAAGGGGGGLALLCVLLFSVGRARRR
jgi:hypothetical protein